MDSTESAGKLIFIFAHISQEFLNQQATGSGRCVIQLPLPPLEIDIWKKLKFSELWDLNEASRNHPSLHQLFLSCSGHPRSIFEGIPVALSKNRSLLTDPNSTAITNARQTIIEMSKFIDFKVVLDVTIKKWFSQLPLSDKEETEWSSSGLLHTLKDTKVQFLFPLLIQQWACDHCDKKPIAYHLQQLYHYDALLDQNTEKYMEAVMYHYEAVLRIAQGGQQFILRTFFRTQHLKESLFSDTVVSGLPNTIPTNVVVSVSSFLDETILPSLESGLIVVSDKHSEIGTEYLVPFRDTNNILMIAFVQCKFVRQSTSWTEIEKKSKQSIDSFKKNELYKNIDMFRVVYTNVDQNTILKSTYNDGIYYTEIDLFNFTNKLGILRLHTQKLGDVLNQRYPILKRASSDLTTSK